MTDVFLPGDPPIALRLRRSQRARRLSLRISQLDGRVTLTVPPRVPEREALAFAREKEAWMRRHLSARDADVTVGPGARLPIAGREHLVVQAGGRRFAIEEGRVQVPGPAERAGRRLGQHLKLLARDRLAEASDRHAARLGRDYSAITLRDTRSRWGSCTADGRLMYSWRLVLAPPEVLDYVAAHEVAHLLHMNHSPAFWSAVEALYGDYRSARAWLRSEGAGLHRYRFG